MDRVKKANIWKNSAKKGFIHFCLTWTIVWGISVTLLIAIINIIREPWFPWLWLFKLYFKRYILISLSGSFVTSLIAWPVYYLKSKKRNDQIQRNRKPKPTKTIIPDRFDDETFVKGIVSGEIKPAKVIRTLDKTKKTEQKICPLIIYDFPQFECQIHAHFNDDLREDNWELIGRAHIKDYSDNILGDLDNYQLSMMRHHFEDKKIEP